MKHSAEFDIAIAGNSLSARIASALLAKNGYRILLLEDSLQSDFSWPFSSVFIENVLATLGGRSCFTHPSPFQVISPGSRITINSENPVETELKREFGERSGTQVSGFLAELQEKGQKINQLLWLNQGLPWSGLKARCRFRFLSIRQRIPIPELKASLQPGIDGFDPLAKEFLKSLFEGLSLCPLEKLSVGEAALLWTQVSRPENLSKTEFDTLLRKRFEQFHGHSESLQNLEKLDFQNQRFIGGHLRDKGAFTAKHLLVGHLRSIRHFFSANGPPLPESVRLLQYKTSDLQGQLSNLLANQVIIGGAVPLRFSTSKEQEATIAAIQAAELRSAEQIQDLLEPALPFAEYEVTSAVETLEVPHEEISSERPATVLWSAPLQFGRNVFCADSSVFCPGMGPAGGALLAWTLANRFGAGLSKDGNRPNRTN